MNFESVNSAETLPKISREQFDKQFSQTNILMAGDKEISYAMAKGSEDPNAEWFVYIGGFAQGSNSYADVLYDVATSGRNIVYVNPLEGIEITNEKIATEMRGLGVPDLIARKANEVKFIMDALEIEHAHIGGHSQGAAVGATLAVMVHDKVSKLLLDAPPGLRDGDNPFRLALSTVLGKRILKKEIEGLANQLETGEVMKREHESEDDYKARLQELDRRVAKLGIMTDGSKAKHRLLWRLRNEVTALSKFHMRPVIQKVKELQGGLNRDTYKNEISIITANMDVTFESDKAVINANGLADSTSSYIGKHESHNAAILAPVGYYSQKLNGKSKR